MINIYCYQNKIDGRVYIGQTHYSLVHRYYSDKYKNCKRLFSAIEKHGLSNFDRWIFTIVDTQKQADQEEIFWIAEMRNTLGRDNVYNISDGGDLNTYGIPLSEEHKKKLSLAKIGTKRSEEAKKKTSKSLLGHKGYWTGKKLSEEHKRKVGEASKGRKASEETKRKIIKARTGTKFSEESRKKMSESARRRNLIKK